VDIAAFSNDGIEKTYPATRVEALVGGSEPKRDPSSAISNVG
jgi:hypothetical protein